MDQIMYVAPSIAVSSIVQVVLALVAFALVWLMLKGFDRANDFSFKDWIRDANDDAVSGYLGDRIIAVCILVGLIVSGAL